LPPSTRRRLGESGEDYLFAADRFVAIDVPAAVKASLLKASYARLARSQGDGRTAPLCEDPLPDVRSRSTSTSHNDSATAAAVSGDEHVWMQIGCSSRKTSTATW